MPPTRVATESPPIQERRRDLRVSPRDWVSEPDVVGMLTHRCKMRSRLCACGFRNSLKDRSHSLTTPPRTAGCVVHRQQTNRGIEPRLVFSAALRSFEGSYEPWSAYSKGRPRKRQGCKSTNADGLPRSCRRLRQQRRRWQSPRGGPSQKVSNSTGASVPQSTGIASESVKQVPDPRCQA
jgi:hypothetical protein